MKATISITLDMKAAGFLEGIPTGKRSQYINGLIVKAMDSQTSRTLPLNGCYECGIRTSLDRCPICNEAVV